MFTLNTGRRRSATLLSAIFLIPLIMSELQMTSASDAGTLPDVVVSKPLLVLADVKSAKFSDDAPANKGFLASTFKVRVEIVKVLAGAPETSMGHGDYLNVLLVAENSGSFRKGTEFIVLLDPKKIANSDALVWTPLTKFACLNREQADLAGLDIDGPRTFRYGDAICIP